MPFDGLLDFFQPRAYVEFKRRPTLKGLAFMLRHKELWPRGFQWNYNATATCAIGLCERYAGHPMGPKSIAPYLGMSYEAASHIFTGLSVRPPSHGGLSAQDYQQAVWDARQRVTPEMVATAIDIELGKGTKMPFDNTKESVAVEPTKFELPTLTLTVEPTKFDPPKYNFASGVFSALLTPNPQYCNCASCQGVRNAMQMRMRGGNANPDDVVRVLGDMRVLLQHPRNWVKGNAHTRVLTDGRWVDQFCLNGALRFSHASAADEIYYAVNNLLDSLARRLGHNSHIHFNDHAKTTHAMLLEFLDKAIEAVRARQQVTGVVKSVIMTTSV